MLKATSAVTAFSKIHLELNRIVNIACLKRGERGWLAINSKEDDSFGTKVA